MLYWQGSGGAGVADVVDSSTGRSLRVLCSSHSQQPLLFGETLLIRLVLQTPQQWSWGVGVMGTGELAVLHKLHPADSSLQKLFLQQQWTSMPGDVVLGHWQCS